ncbi:MAG: hypothetical protein H5T47_02390 [Archaeoglobi archaeon]|nr:hypothetical protein [Candidatus Mnemosynella bozhongmuii]
MSFKPPDVRRIAHFVELDPFRIKEVLKRGRCTFISRYFYNPGIYRVKNSRTKKFENFAISIDKVESASYEDLVERFGEDVVDESLWEGLSKKEHIYFYAFSLAEIEREEIMEASSWRSTGRKEVSRRELLL